MSCQGTPDQVGADFEVRNEAVRKVERKGLFSEPAFREA